MERSHFLKSLASLPLVGASLKLNAIEKISNSFPKSKKTPLIFIGHGLRWSGLAGQFFMH